MESFLPIPSDGAEEDSFVSSTIEQSDTSPLLRGNEDIISPVKTKWQPGPGFLWIEIGRPSKIVNLKVVTANFYSNLFQRLPIGL